MAIALTSGVTLCLLTRDQVLDPPATLTWLAEQSITVLHGTPTQFQALVADFPELPEPRNNLAVLYEEAGEENASVRKALRAAGASMVIPAGSGAAWVGFFPDRAGLLRIAGLLGAAVHAYDDAGQAVTDQVGELVVTEPMPSMPLFFWASATAWRARVVLPDDSGP